ncbi:MAG: hypothetical protein Q8O89_03285 [Nanoarchaeota archaeon]|nr:hypothetical protein [Nanoarchaeota archaeon]
MVRDVQLDTSEVILEKQFYCYSCKIPMNKLSDKLYKCPSCEEAYSEEE